jgi:hypothetical protein
MFHTCTSVIGGKKHLAKQNVKELKHSSCGKKQLAKQNAKELEHPSYSLDLLQCIIFLFSKPKSVQEGQKFASCGEITAKAM